MTTGIFVANRRFFDDKKYPRGFARSGDFTIKEATLLEQHGEAMKSLHDGKQTANGDIESQFVAVCRGEREAENDYEKVWLKYLKKSNNKRFFTLFGSSKKANTDAEADDRDYSEEDELA